MAKLTTRDRILHSALKLLETKGIKAVTQLAVAKAIGIPQGQLTYHFPKRLDLVLAVTDLSLDKIAGQVFQNPAAKGKIADLIWKLINNQERIRALLGILAEGDDSEKVRALLAERQARARLLIAAGLGCESDDERITMVHATLIGFGVLSFARPENSSQLQKDFLATFKLLEAVLRKKGNK